MKYLPLLLVMLMGLTITEAQARSRKIIILETMPVRAIKDTSTQIQSALLDLAEGHAWQVDIEVFEAQGSRGLASDQLRASIDRMVPDLVISLATLATQAAKEVLAGSEIPVLFSIVTDPVGSGIVDQVGVPSGTNISGFVYNRRPDTRLEMVNRLLSGTPYEKQVTIGVIHSDYPASLGDFAAVKEAAEIYRNIEIVNYQIPYRAVPDRLPEMLEDMRQGIEALRGQVDFFWEVTGPLSETVEATRVLVDSGIPLINGSTPKAARDGALLVVAPNIEHTARELVQRAEQVLLGKPVGQFTVAAPEKFDFYINMKTAKRLNLHVPSHMLMIAGPNIIQ